MRAFGAALAGLLAGSVAAAQPAPVFRKPTLAEDLQMFSQVLNQLRLNHLDSLDSHALILAAVEGMIAAADPHSYLLPVARLTAERAQAWEAGKLVPVPIGFQIVRGAPVVTSVTPGSAAARQDVLVGDELLAADGQPVVGTSGEEVAIALAGEKNSTVRLTLARQRSDGSRIEVDRSVKRQLVDEATAVPAVEMVGPETGYLRITTFTNPKVGDDLHDAIGRLKGRGMRRLILDLRDNGGGLVDEAARVAGEFLPTGAVVYIAERKKAEKPDTVTVKRSFWKQEDRYPVIVLVNDGTASASELVAGALQDHDRALIMGRPTFGKSLLMRGFPLIDGSVIMMAFGRVRTPCGRVVQRGYRGVTRRDYYRVAGAVLDTAGRPSCRTAAGRTVYGGGGVFPDLLVPLRPAPPVWVARLDEDDLPLAWVGGYLTGAALPPLDSLIAARKAPAAAVASFRQFAAGRGAAIPDGAEADARLERLLLSRLVFAKWGEAGYYRLAAAVDPMVAEAVAAFGTHRLP
ncbi:MAG: PDZ domain-containing protein [Gemmatimonadetes bacterium]|nr:PDZ domain-containing protein [Gemmatimonadota bacterium]